MLTNLERGPILQFLKFNGQNHYILKLGTKSTIFKIEDEVKGPKILFLNLRYTFSSLTE